jgi:hypothetical protein
MAMLCGMPASRGKAFFSRGFETCQRASEIASPRALNFDHLRVCCNHSVLHLKRFIRLPLADSGNGGVAGITRARKAFLSDFVRNLNVERLF